METEAMGTAQISIPVRTGITWVQATPPLEVAARLFSYAARGGLALVNPDPIPEDQIAA